MKYSRTAYTGQPLKSVLAELVNECDLKKLDHCYNADLNSRRHLEDHPDLVRVTITVERVTRTKK